jgi:hypothetical protein
MLNTPISALFFPKRYSANIQETLGQLFQLITPILRDDMAFRRMHPLFYEVDTTPTTGMSVKAEELSLMIESILTHYTHLSRSAHSNEGKVEELCKALHTLFREGSPTQSDTHTTQLSLPVPPESLFIPKELELRNPTPHQLLFGFHNATASILTDHCKVLMERYLCFLYDPSSMFNFQTAAPYTLRLGPRILENFVTLNNYLEFISQQIDPSQFQIIPTEKRAQLLNTAVTFLHAYLMTLGTQSKTDKQVEAAGAKVIRTPSLKDIMNQVAPIFFSVSYRPETQGIPRDYLVKVVIELIDINFERGTREPIENNPGIRAARHLMTQLHPESHFLPELQMRISALLSITGRRVEGRPLTAAVLYNANAAPPLRLEASGVAALDICDGITKMTNEITNPPTRPMNDYDCAALIDSLNGIREQEWNSSLYARQSLDQGHPPIILMDIYSVYSVLRQHIPLLLRAAPLKWKGHICDAWRACLYDTTQLYHQGLMASFTVPGHPDLSKTGDEIYRGLMGDWIQTHHWFSQINASFNMSYPLPKPVADDQRQDYDQRVAESDRAYQELMKEIEEEEAAEKKQRLVREQREQRRIQKEVERDEKEAHRKAEQVRLASLTVAVPHEHKLDYNPFKNSLQLAKDNLRKGTYDAALADLASAEQTLVINGFIRPGQQSRECTQIQLSQPIPLEKLTTPFDIADLYLTMIDVDRMRFGQWTQFSQDIETSINQAKDYLDIVVAQLPYITNSDQRECIKLNIDIINGVITKALNYATRREERVMEQYQEKQREFEALLKSKKYRHKSKGPTKLSPKTRLRHRLKAQLELATGIRTTLEKGQQKVKEVIPQLTQSH